MRNWRRKPTSRAGKNDRNIKRYHKATLAGTNRKVKFLEFGDDKRGHKTYNWRPTSRGLEQSS